jgi:lycopene cyclase domain-containing protein
MPIEEYLFFICIPFACVFSYHAFTTLFRFRDNSRLITWIYAILTTLLLIGGVINITRLYTGVTFLLLSVLLAFCLRKRAQFLAAFLVTFSFILIPFLISNGILTGSFLGRVVVRYNDQENLGIRLLTIPIEDIFYAMLLLLLNVYCFEWRRQIIHQNPHTR